MATYTKEQNTKLKKACELHDNVFNQLHMTPAPFQGQVIMQNKDNIQFILDTYREIIGDAWYERT